MKRKRCVLISVVLLLFAAAVLAVIFSKPQEDTFDFSVLDVDNIHSKIETITDEPYFGRLTGSKENNELLEYIKEEFEALGLKPAGVGDTYYQPLSLIVPKTENDPVFNLMSENNKVIRELSLYKDYNLISSMNGGGIDFEGDLLFVKDKLFSIEPGLIKDKVVVIEAEELSSSEIGYVIENKGKGIFCCADFENEGRQRKYEQQKSLSMSGKTGEAIAAGYISAEAYEYLLSYFHDINGEKEQTTNIISKVTIKADINYPIVETANILGKIEGSSDSEKVLIISANIDGAGWGLNGDYFEGAARNASGLSMLLETARIIASQDSLPYQTIVFMGLNGQEEDFSGSNYYVNNPLFSLENSKIVHLEAVGVQTANGLLVASDKQDDMVLRDSIIDKSVDKGLLVRKSVAGACAVSPFAEAGVSAVILYDTNITYNVYADTIEIIDNDYLENASLVLLNYVESNAYLNMGEGSLSGWDKFIAVVSSPIRFVKNIFSASTDTASSISENGSVLRTSVYNSLQLLISSLLLSIIVGITSGLYSGYRNKRKRLGSLGPLVWLSVPDVLIILLGWKISTLYGMNLPAMEEILPLSNFIIPMITMTIIPSIYISRITFITVQDELKKSYLRNSKAKGFSGRRIIFSELMPAGMFKIIDSLPTLMTMLLGNLIVVEYLYNYLGAAYYLIYFYSNKAYYEFIVLVIALGLIYTIFTWVIQLIAKSVNPVKQEVKK